MSSVNRSFVIDCWLERLPWASGWGGIGLAAGAIVLSLVAFWLAGGWQAYQVFGAAAVHLLFPPLVIVYILIVVQALERTVGSKKIHPIGNTGLRSRAIVVVDDTSQYVATPDRTV